MARFTDERLMTVLFIVFGTTLAAPIPADNSQSKLIENNRNHHIVRRRAPALPSAAAAPPSLLPMPFSSPSLLSFLPGSSTATAGAAAAAATASMVPYRARSAVPRRPTVSNTSFFRQLFPRGMLSTIIRTKLSAFRFIRNFLRPTTWWSSPYYLR